MEGIGAIYGKADTREEWTKEHFRDSPIRELEARCIYRVVITGQCNRMVLFSNFGFHLTILRVVVFVSTSIIAIGNS